MEMCKWPGCKVRAQNLCGEHQIAMKIALGVIYPLREELHLGEATGDKWAHRFAPHIVARTTRNSPWVLLETVTTKFTVRVLMQLGKGERAAYNCAGRLRKDGEIPTKDLIKAAVMMDQWLPISKAATHVGVSHRYLRHLVYEDRIPEITRLTTKNSLAKGQVGFMKGVIPELRSTVR